MTGEHYLFAGGGTGGHLFPGLAVAEALRDMQPAARITFFTTLRDLDRQLLGTTSYEQVTQTVQPVTMQPLRWPAFGWHWLRSVSRARQFIRRNDVRAVLGLGGYAAGPPVVAARSAGVRSTILNPDAVPGRANRFLARRADWVVLQWNVTHRYFPANTVCHVLGCPIRREFATPDAAAGRRRFNLDAARPLLLVTGASQGAHTINETMKRVWPVFHATHPDWQLLHLTGAAEEQSVRDVYAAAGAPANVVAFTHEMANALAAADLVVSRAGASTLAELTAIGRPSILFPYPYHRDRHQHHNAQVLVDAGAAMLIEDTRDAAQNQTPLLAALHTCAPAAKRSEMAAAARKTGRPDAAQAVARLLMDEQ